MKSIAFLAMWLLSVASLLLFTSCNRGDGLPEIGYVQIAPDPVLEIARNSLIKTLQDSGFVDGKNYVFLEKNAQGDLSMIPSILQTFVSRNVDVVVTNSTPCMVAAAQMVKEIPVVFTVAFGPGQVKMKSIPQNLYGVYDPYRVSDYFDVITACIPGLKAIGLPYNTSEPNALYAAERVKEECARRGIRVETAAVTSTNDILMAGQSLTTKEIGAIVVAADNVIHLGLNTLAGVADKAGIPLFVSDPMQVQKGAALGFGANYEKWGHESGLKVVDLLKGRPVLEKISTTKDYTLVINRKAAAAQGLNIPTEITGRADLVIE